MQKFVEKVRNFTFFRIFYFNIYFYVHLNEPTPTDLIIRKDEKTWSKPRGVAQRNKGIAWLIENSEKLHHAGVVYFADDDNTYDIRLFEEVFSLK